MAFDLQSANYSFGTDTFAELIEVFKADAGFFLPEFTLIGTICLLFLVTLIVPRQNQRALAWLAAVGIFTSMFFLAEISFAEPTSLFQGMVAHDSFAVFFKFVFLLSALAVVAMTYVDESFENFPMGEYYGLILSSVLGMFLLASATDLLMLFLALELVSIPTYLLVVYRKQDRSASEAAFKYVIYGSVAGGVMLYGLSLFYGLTGSTAIADMATLQVDGVNNTVLTIAGLLVFAGFAYKIAAVPMHFWAPDIYEGAPTTITAFLSVGSKAAGFAGLIRFLDGMDMGEGLRNVSAISATLDWATLLGLLSAVSMTFGNLAALFQTNVKRMLAYSSIAHAGYLLMGLAAMGGSAYGGGVFGSVRAVEAVGYYMLAFLFMNMGAFTVIVLFANRLKSETIDDYKGLGARAPLASVCLTICLVSLVGIPPTGGFVGKFLLFAVVVKQSMYWLALVAGVNTAISVYYYLRIIKNLFLEQSTETEPLEISSFGQTLVFALTLGVLVLGTLFSVAANWVRKMDIHDPPASTASIVIDVAEGH